MPRSVRARLLAGLLLLLGVWILALDGVTWWILSRDRRAYVFQSQASEARIAAESFGGRVRLARGGNRLALYATLPSAVESAGALPLRVWLAGQSTVLSTLWTDFAEGSVPPEWTGSERASGELSERSVPVTVTDAWRRVEASAGSAAPSLGVWVRPGQSPVLWVAELSPVVAGRRRLAVTSVSLEGLGLEDSASTVEIRDLAGRPLYSNDPALLLTEAKRAEAEKGAPARPGLAAGAGAGISTAEVPTDAGSDLVTTLKDELGFTVLLRASWQMAARSIYEILERLLSMGAMGLAAGVAFSVLFARGLTAPLAALAGATARIQDGDFGVQVAAGSRDEIGALGRSFNAMSTRIAELVEEQKEKVRLENEVKIAATVQQTLIPAEDAGGRCFRIRSAYVPASSCGGDWWGYFESRDRVVFFVADATGHGLPSALLTAAIRAAASSVEWRLQSDPDHDLSPSQLLHLANKVIFDSAGGKLQMTLFAGVIDLGSGLLSYASAGHPPLWLLRQDAAGGGGVEVRSLGAPGTRLGEAPAIGEPVIEQQEIVLPGDVLFFYSDGLLDGTNSAGEAYGKRRARRAIVEAVAGNLDAEAPARIIAGVIGEFREFTQGKPPDDDLTCVALRLEANRG